MNETIKTWMSYYELSPSLKLYDNTLLITEDEKRLHDLIEPHNNISNPIDVVIESVYNVISENISCEYVTESDNTIIMTNQVKKRAVDEILNFLQENIDVNLKELHGEWLIKLHDYLLDMYDKDGNLNKHEVLYRVSEKFRISGLSSIRAINSI